MDQQHGDIFIPDSRVKVDDVLDHTNQFTTDKIFKSKAELIEWTRSEGTRNNFVIVIRRFDSGKIGNKKKRPKIRFCCERNGQYKSYKSMKSDINTQKSDEDSRKEKRPRLTSTKKCGCPFSLRGINIENGDEWKLEVVCGVHNHVASEYLHGHSFAGRLSEKENSLLVDMSMSLMRPKEILTAIKRRNPKNVTAMKTIYNSRQRHRTKIRAGRKQMQQLLSNLFEHKYIEHHRSDGDKVTDLFWCHPYSIEILRTFPHVLIMDCTYKTNRYRFPLLEIVGITSTNKTFNVAFAYISKEKEDNYTWALTRLKTLLDDKCAPSVMVTDRELALMNSISNVFLNTRHVLCRWHINKQVLTHCKKLFATKEGWDIFNNDWQSVVNSNSEDEYSNNLKLLESKFSTFPGAIDYLKTTWLNSYKDRFVAAWIDTCMHLGTTTSNRVESAHSKLKRQLGSSQLDFSTSWDYIHSLMELHHTEIKASFEKSQCFVQHQFKHAYLKELIGNVSIIALNKIVRESNRVDAVGVNVVSCGCAIRRTHQLPCAHEIAEYQNSHQPIPIDAIHSHWTQLSVGNFVEEIDPQEKVMVRPRLTQLQKWLEEQDDETKRQVLLKIDELINPSCTMLQEPNEKIKTKGRPSKIDSSTRRLPSAFEIAEAFSVHGSQSQVPPEKVVNASPSTVLPCTKSNKHPEKNQPICVTQSTSPFDLTQKYTAQFVFSMRPYILGSFDVESDGNCGHRVVASAMRFGRRFWRRVRIDLMNELKSMPHLYMKLYGSEGSVENIKQRLNHSGSAAPRRKWMCITEMGHLIATCYGVVVINLSDKQCLTFLPLTEHITGRFQNQELPEIGIGFVNGDHFVQVFLQAGCPLPPIPPNWYPHADDKARSLYNRYKDRLHQYTQIPHPERVTAISEIITLETDETMFE